MGPVIGDGDGSFVFTIHPLPATSAPGGAVGVSWDGGSTFVGFRYHPITCDVLPPSTIEFEPNGGNKVYAITTRVFCEFLATSNDDWINVSTITSGAEAKIDVTVPANPLSTMRAGTITVMVPFRTPQIITITQKSR